MFYITRFSVRKDNFYPNVLHKAKHDHCKDLSFQKAQQLKMECLWNELKKFTLQEAVIVWLSSLNTHTARSYKGSILALSKIGLLSLNMTLQEFSFINHNIVIDTIKMLPQKIVSWSEGTKQVRAACYISLTKFLNRTTLGVISVAQPSRQESCKTFFKTRDLVKTNAMNYQETALFLEALKKLNYRDWLIAQTILQGAKRVSEVLSLSTKDISIQNGVISFKQKKTRGTETTTIITYPQKFMNALKEYIGNRSGIVFITRNGKHVTLRQVAGSFSRAGEIIKLPFKVTPHVLRATAVTEYKRLGCSDSDIMKVTGHVSSKMIYAYDKSSKFDNASKKVTLI